MKGFWWGDPIVLGGKVKRGYTIWDEIGDEMERVPVAELVELFTTETAKPKAVAKKKEEGDGDGKKKAEKEKAKPTLKIIRIVTDPNAILSKETALKNCPVQAEKIFEAITSLDDSLFDDDQLASLGKEGTATDGEYAMLMPLREQHPQADLALPESFMDLCNGLNGSEGVAALLGLVLAIGNYLNGGTNRGQADGFDIAKGLGECGNCKDKNGKELTQFIIKCFSGSQPEAFNRLIEDLSACFMNTARKFVKEEGADKLKKKSQVVLEDYDGLLGALDKECKEIGAMLKECIQDIDDPADEFRTRMPEMFAAAEKSVKDLMDLSQQTWERYRELLAIFNMDSKMKTDEFCMLWDNFFVPTTKVDAQDPAIKAKYINPYFCNDDKAPGASDILMFWGIQEWNEKEAASKERSGRGKRGADRGPKRMRRRLSQTKGLTRVIDGKEVEGGAGAKAGGEEKSLPAGPGGKGKDGKGKKGVGKGPGKSSG